MYSKGDSSQCLYAGTGVMNFSPTYGWDYINANKKAPAWTGVEYFRNFLVRAEPSPVFIILCRSRNNCLSKNKKPRILFAKLLVFHRNRLKSFYRYAFDVYSSGLGLRRGDRFSLEVRNCQCPGAWDPNGRGEWAFVRKAFPSGSKIVEVSV